MCEPFLAAFRLLAIELVLVPVFCGLGLHLRRLFGLRDPTVHDLFVAFWSGWVLGLAFLQVWHLWLPVDVRALVALAVLGGAGAIRELYALRRLLVPGVAAAGGLLLGLGVAALALRPLLFFDTGAYHLATVDWIRAYPIVPGLGNLHGRLAFNSSFYLYAALLETLWTGGARYLANSLLFFVLLLQVLRSSFRYLRARLGSGGEPSLYDFFSLLLLGPTVAQTVGYAFSSLSSDLPVFVLGIAATLSVLRLATRTESFREGLYAFSTIVLMAAGGMAVKLSFMVHGALLVILASAFLWHGVRDRKAVYASLGLVPALAGVVMVPWAVRSVYLSGYVVFPGGYLPVDVDWRVPRSLALDHEYFVYSIARGLGHHWVQTRGNWSWLERWWRELPGSAVRPLFVTLLAALLAIARLVRRPWRDPPREAPAVVLVTVASLLSLVWWFLSAPDLRFAGALLGLLAAAASAFAFFRTGPRPIDLVAAAVFLGILAIPTYDFFYDDSHCHSPDWDYVTRTTDSGLAVHVPARGIQCWNLPLPSTPYFRPSLSARHPGDLSQGFFLEKTVTLANLEQGSIPEGFRVSPDLGIHPVSGLRPHEGSGPRLAGEARLLLYSQRRTRVRARLVPRSIERQGAPLESCELTVRLEGRPVKRIELQPQVPAELVLSLSRDFNDLVLEASAADAETDGLHEVLPLSNRVVVTFDGIDFESVPQDQDPGE